MNGLLPLILSAVTRDIGAAARHTKRKVILYAIMALFLLTAYVAGIWGCAVLAVRHFGPLGGALMVTLAFIALSLAVLATIAILDHLEKKRVAREALSGRTMMLATAAALLPTAVKSRGLMALLVAGGVGLAFLSRRGGGGSDDLA